MENENPSIEIKLNGKKLGWIKQSLSGMWRGYLYGSMGFGPLTKKDAEAFVLCPSNYLWNHGGQIVANSKADHPWWVGTTR